ncbi:MAG: RNA polymerase sigma factor [Vicinamibacterales bacterium]
MVPVQEPDYEQYIVPVNAVVARVARRYRLTDADSEDLRSDLWVKLLAERGRALRRFHGGSKIETYLNIVARNLLLDHRNKAWGKWHVSAAAVRGGALGEQLDRLISRDGLSVDAAEQCLRCAGLAPDSALVRRVAASLPIRHRRTFIGVESLVDQPADVASPYDRACLSERRAASGRVRTALASVLRTLSERDRLLLVWRYADGKSVADIARTWRVDVKCLYRDCDRLLSRLREALDAAGIEETLVRNLLADARSSGGDSLEAAADRRRPENRRLA